MSDMGDSGLAGAVDELRHNFRTFGPIVGQVAQHAAKFDALDDHIRRHEATLREGFAHMQADNAERHGRILAEISEVIARQDKTNGRLLELERENIRRVEREAVLATITTRSSAARWKIATLLIAAIGSGAAAGAFLVPS